MEGNCQGGHCLGGFSGVGIIGEEILRGVLLGWVIVHRKDSRVRIVQWENPSL